MVQSESVHRTVGTRNYAINDREKDDYYATEPDSLRRFLRVYNPPRNTVWECACGNGNLSRVLEERGYDVISTDLVDRGYGKSGVDFLTAEPPAKGFCIITNPPFKLATEFVLRAMEVCDSDVVFVMPVRYLESKRRYNELFRNKYLKAMYVPVKRIQVFRNNESEHAGNAMCFTWMVFNRNNNGDAVIRWIE